MDLSELTKTGKLILGDGVRIDDNVIMCYPDELSDKNGIFKPTKVGDGTVIRAGSVIYQGADIGAKNHP